MNFSRHVLDIDSTTVTEVITDAIRRIVSDTCRRRGAVVGVSGGIDSAVCAALCARALGAERTFVLLMPERDSSDESLRLGRQVVERFGLRSATIDLTPILEAVGCYRSQQLAIQMVVPEYGPGWKHKVVLPSILSKDRLNVPRLVVEDPQGQRQEVRLNAKASLQLVAATNFKQRVRTMLEYFHADRLHFAVCGTANRLEHDQGFFVKGGDGLADFKPIAHLYKSQVFSLARHLGVPPEICERPPTTDTYSLAQTQEEFFFAVPYETMDLCLYAHNHAVAATEVAPVVGLTPEQVQRIFDDIETKRRTTAPLHLGDVFVEPVRQVGVTPSRYQQTAGE